ncbi:hypothetical protein Drorol1_Dr00005585 [Drosera rotundifolia]
MTAATGNRTRKKPLILASTAALLDSLRRTPSQTTTAAAGATSLRRDSAPTLELQAGILRVSKGERIGSLDDSALVGLSTASLKRLAITSGSLVLVKNTETNIQRVAQVVALDPPSVLEPAHYSAAVSSHAHHTLSPFPSYCFPIKCHVSVGQTLAYLSPLLAFNIGMHISCLTSLLGHGMETLASLFEIQEGKDTSICENKDSDVCIRLETWPHFPRYASHLRVSFVKMPQCGTIESLKGKSSIETKYRQEMIDAALQEYFRVNRYLTEGDVFSITISWNCNSSLCINCAQKQHKNGGDVIYFKVLAIDPSEERVLRINRTQTALVLGGSVPSAVPPDWLTDGLTGTMPLHGDTVKILASALTPPLCPSVLSAKFKVSILLHGSAGSGKRTVVRYVAARLGLHVVEYSCKDLMAASEKKASAALAQAFTQAYRYAPTIVLLRHCDVLRNFASHEGSSLEQLGIASDIASVIKEFTDPATLEEEKSRKKTSNDESLLMDIQKISKRQILLVATADTAEGLPSPIRRCFSHEISMGPFTEEKRAMMLSQLLGKFSKVSEKVDVDDFVKDLVAQTSGFMPRDLTALVADAGANLVPKFDIDFDSKTARDKKSHSAEPAQLQLAENSPQVLGKEDMLHALERSKKRNAAALGTPKVPNTKWEDVGGLEDVKKAILDTVQLPLLHKDLFASGLRKRSGVLLYGPPGTGKTLLAKAVATECSLNFLSVKGPELINMYIGESEKNVRDIFQKARLARPCVIFFDELDSLAPARGASGDSGGVMDRVVSQMLAEIDGLNDSSQDLFVIGASNRPDLIDPALLRPGRFDKLLYVGVNSDASYRKRILLALTRKFQLHEDVSLYTIAKRCPPNFTGADMYALCADAWFHAAKRKVSSSQSDSSSDLNADAVCVEYVDFMKALSELSPSLSLAELQKYEKLRDQFEGVS